MIEHEQKNVIMNCPICSETKDRLGRIEVSKRRFISHANYPNKFICTSPGCGGYTIELTNKELKAKLREDG